METIFGAENGPPLPSASSMLDDPEAASDRRDVRRLSTPRNRGAVEYSGSNGGTLVIILMRILTSMFGWRMVSFMLNGAIS